MFSLKAGGFCFPFRISASHFGVGSFLAQQLMLLVLFFWFQLWTGGRVACSSFLILGSLGVQHQGCAGMKTACGSI